MVGLNPFSGQESVRPSWTLFYNLDSGDGWIGTGWEFFASKAAAERRREVLLISGAAATLRPYHHTSDSRHLGAVHHEIRQNKKI